MSSNVVELIQPAYRVHREVDITSTDHAVVTKELKTLLRKAPYPVGHPDPTGSLRLKLPGVSFRFSIGVYHHGCFNTGQGLTPEAGMIFGRGTELPNAYYPILRTIVEFLHRRGYVLEQVWVGLKDPDQKHYTWSYGPNRSKGYERIAMGAIIST